MTLRFRVPILYRQRLRRIAAVMLSSVMLVFLCVVPVAAQTATPTPTLSASPSAFNRGDITPAGLLVAATSIIAGVVSGMILIVIKVVDDRQKARDDAREETQRIAEEKRQLDAKEAEAKRAQDQAAIANQSRLIELLAQVVESAAEDRKEASTQRALTTQHLETTAATQKDTVVLVKDIRTRKEAQDDAAETVSAVASLSSNVDDAVKSLNAARDEVQKAAAAMPTLTQIDEAFKQRIEPLEDQLTQLIEMALSAKKRDTGRLPPLPETPPDAAQPNTNPN